MLITLCNIVCVDLPGVCLLDHVDQPQQLLDSDAGLTAAELAGQFGDVLLGEGVTLTEQC